MDRCPQFVLSECPIRLHVPCGFAIWPFSTTQDCTTSFH
ncbi:Uncharacterised protein [Vibrio cholerae]|nr:Uncharacterised protein [Vibrio cholerae]